MLLTISLALDLNALHFVFCTLHFYNNILNDAVFSKLAAHILIQQNKRVSPMLTVYGLILFTHLWCNTVSIGSSIKKANRHTLKKKHWELVFFSI